MPRKKRKVVKKNSLPPVVSVPEEPRELREFVAESELVALMTRQRGWDILKRDCETYKQKIGSRLAYLSPKSTIYEETRILYLASDKLLGMVEDYAENRKRAEEVLYKIDNPEENIVLDVDNRTS